MKLGEWNSGKLFSIIKSGFFLVFIILLSKGCSPDISINPEWAKDLVIYEIATKGFTSPNGPESGTFKSLKEKMAYLQDLGINAIWLTGHSLSDPKHFYGIWTQYACIEPDKLDPSLGTEQDFKEMIDEAHRRGIRIILDTIEHGVMNSSTLIKKHPDWFKGGSWGMTDYDWEGDHPDLEKWWVEMWTKAVLEWGVDGFRCDCGLHRPDLWQEIKRRCADAGKPIFILGESGIENISDACQRDIMLFNQVEGCLDNHSVLRNLPSVEDLFHKPLDWTTMNVECEIQYEDGTISTDNNHGGDFQITFTGLGDDVIGTWESEPDGMKDWTWLIEVADLNRKIKNIKIECPERNWQWQSDGWGWKLAVEYNKNNQIKISGGNPLPGPKLRVISPSCHDCGWDSFPLDKNPYTTQGSRHIMGYGVLFAPAIPIIMSGDEFDAEYKALPNHTPDLYGKGEAGTGRWLYGSWLQWDQLKEKRHSDMHKDVKRMLAIRREHTDLIRAIKPGETDIKMKAIPVLSDNNLPVPYILSNGKRALLVIGNPTNKDLNVKLNISNDILGFAQTINELKATILWPDTQETVNITKQELSQYSCIVPADYNRGGGLHIIRFEILH